MPVRWRRSSPSVRVISFAGLSPGDLLLLAGSRQMLAPTRWRPATDVCETAEAVTLTIELAGVREEDLDIDLYADAVVVEGRRAPRTCGADAVYHALEIRHGEFRIEVPLPAGVDGDQPVATLEDGFLRITIPKSAGRRIPLTDRTHDG